MQSVRKQYKALFASSQLIYIEIKYTDCCFCGVYSRHYCFCEAAKTNSCRKQCREVKLMSSGSEYSWSKCIKAQIDLFWWGWGLSWWLRDSRSHLDDSRQLLLNTHIHTLQTRVNQLINVTQTSTNKQLSQTHPSTDFALSSGLRTVKGLGSRPTVFGMNSLKDETRKRNYEKREYEYAYRKHRNIFCAQTAFKATLNCHSHSCIIKYQIFSNF